jgi:hypothetical protein
MHPTRTVRLVEQLKNLADQALFVVLPFFTALLGVSLVGL